MTQQRINEIVGFIYIAIAILVLVSLMTYEPADLTFFASTANVQLHNFVGIIGAYIGAILFFLIGQSAYIIPFLCFVWAIDRFTSQQPQRSLIKFSGTTVLFLATSSFLALIFNGASTVRMQAGGIFGMFLSSLLNKYFGTVGSYIIVITLMVLSILLATEFLIIPFFVYFIIALGSNLQVGIRHLLPIYPLCFVISARSIGLFRYRLSKTIIAFFSLWIILGTIMIYPHFLSYFNEIAGGPDNGWRYLRDSNIDWGQDLPALSTYIKENKIDVITLAYFGEDLPKEYGIKEIPFKETEHTRPENKVYAISVQGLDSVKWAKDYTPDAKMGYSIFVYDFRDKKL